jgi:hypothetical protein
VQPTLHPAKAEPPDSQNWVFRHTPNRRLPLNQRWPQSLEAQACSTPPGLSDVWIWLQPHLCPASTVALAAKSTTFCSGGSFSSLWLYRPWSPHCCRRWGFGIPSSNHIATHDEATYHFMLHFAWSFLAPRDRQAAVKVSSIFSLDALSSALIESSD